MECREDIAGPIKESSAFQLLTSKTKLEGLEEMEKLASDPVLAMEKLEKAQRVTSRIQNRGRELVDAQAQEKLLLNQAGQGKDWEKAKGALKNAIIGFVLIFVLILGLNLLMPTMIDWVNKNSGQKGNTINQTEITNAQNGTKTN